MEERSARLTLLVDPKMKMEFEKLCTREDVTASQKIRQLINQYLDKSIETKISRRT